SGAVAGQQRRIKEDLIQSRASSVFDAGVGWNGGLPNHLNAVGRDVLDERSAVHIGEELSQKAELWIASSRPEGLDGEKVLSRNQRRDGSANVNFLCQASGMRLRFRVEGNRRSRITRKAASGDLGSIQ